MPFLGELAALGTAACWASGSLLFTIAARRTDALALNQTRITLAAGVLALLTVLTHGLNWAPQAEVRHMVLLLISGWVGLTLGDWAYFGSFVDLGPRLATLLMALGPPMTALLALAVLDEPLGSLALAGMALTLGGVVWVVLERPRSPIPSGHRVRGVLLGALGSLGQAVGLVLSKMGMEGGVDPLPATTLRMIAAVLGTWIVAASLRRPGGMTRIFRDRTARRATLGATVLGPVAGVWLSLVAVAATDTGVAATLMATVPVLVLPLVRFFHGERVSARAVLGATVAVAGVALLFLR